MDSSVQTPGMVSFARCLMGPVHCQLLRCLAWSLGRSWAYLSWWVGSGARGTSVTLIAAPPPPPALHFLPVVRRAPGCWYPGILGLLEVLVSWYPGILGLLELPPDCPLAAHSHFPAPRHLPPPGQWSRVGPVALVQCRMPPE